MFTSGMIDVVIGVIFVFLVFSLIVSGVNEAITRLFEWRSRHLWRALRELLDGQTLKGSEDARPVLGGTDDSWTGKLYAHPLVSQLERRLRTRSRISRIPTADFSRALIDLVIPADGDPTTVDQVRARVKALPDGTPLKEPMLSILSVTGQNIDDLRQDVGDWFDSRMRALSRVYKSHTRWLLLVIALVVALAFNVDAIGAADQLYRNDALRAAVAQEATSVASSCEAAEDPVQCTRDKVGTVDTAVRLPVGWPDPDGIAGWQWLGWLVAAIALSQGAPFWFDLLRKASSLRS